MNNESEPTAILKEILVWTKVGFYESAKAMLASVLNSDKKRWAYQLLDGERSIESIRKELKMSPNDLSDLFKQCVYLGLMEQFEAGKRRRLFDLTNFDMLPPKPAVEKAEKDE